MFPLKLYPISSDAVRQSNSIFLNARFARAFPFNSVRENRKVQTGLVEYFDIQEKVFLMVCQEK
jgi:hypothetical protein